ncbi:hydroxyacid dehydrogenase [Xylophilus rhododendri]|uniref:Hydroxyacid dehydrogenase n=2 Tax=Xylophilus rhododendri TaxID=2697032 RepID=A0A857JET1_9BURK|nr:hydroxyacid dehydrogenase [Xylophilus rhododendri]
MHPAGDALLAGKARILVAPDTGADTLRRLVGDADYLLVRNHLPADLLDRPHRLRGIVRNGTGLDMIPVEAATAQSIPVANVPGANAQAVAEYCAGAMLELARRFGAMDRKLRDQGWAQARALSASTFEISGRTLGIVGLGNVGQRLARIAHAGFGMRVLGYQPGDAPMPDFVELVPLEALLGASDFVSLHCPLTEETRHLIDARSLALMKPSAFLLNAARGEVVDEAALADALAARRLAGAAVDVFTEQPLRRDHPFLPLNNILLTPHAAALTEESSRAMSTGAARQILQLMAGQRPDHLVNPQVWQARGEVAA